MYAVAACIVLLTAAIYATGSRIVKPNLSRGLLVAQSLSWKVRNGVTVVGDVSLGRENGVDAGCKGVVACTRQAKENRVDGGSSLLANISSIEKCNRGAKRVSSDQNLGVGVLGECAADLSCVEGASVPSLQAFQQKFDELTKYSICGV